MAPLKTQAVILRSIDWQDTSRITTLYTREAGKIKAIARGARRLKSPYQGIVESMNRVEALIYCSERRQIQILGEVSLEDSFSLIKKDYYKTGYVYAMLELADHFLPEEESDPVFFDFFAVLLGEMEKAADGRIIFWYYLLKFCSYLGFRLNFSTCLVCGQEAGEKESRFSLADGGITCSACRGAVHGGWALAVAERKFLDGLQGASHRRLSESDFGAPGPFPYTEFLLAYLRQHTDENLVLSSLKIFK